MEENNINLALMLTASAARILLHDLATYVHRQYRHSLESEIIKINNCPGRFYAKLLDNLDSRYIF